MIELNRIEGGIVAHVLQENLRRALAVVARHVSSKSTLPVLTHVAISTAHGKLQLAATNLETAAITEVGGKVDTEGSITVPAKLLTDLVNNLPNDKITLEVDERTQALTVTCARTKATIKGIAIDEYPALPTAQSALFSVTVAGDKLHSLVKATAYACAKDDNRPTLRGVLFSVTDGKLWLSATDGYRLAVECLPLTVPVSGDPVDVIIYGPGLVAIADAFKEAEEPVTLTVSANRNTIVATDGVTMVMSRLVDGKYPEYRRILPTNHTTRCVVDAAVLMAAVKRAGIMAFESKILRLDTATGSALRPGTIGLRANHERAEGADEVDALVDGLGVATAVNQEYFRNALDALNCENIVIELNTETTPVVLRPADNDDALHLIMPMSVK